MAKWRFRPPDSLMPRNDDALGQLLSIEPERLRPPTILRFAPAIPKQEASFLDRNEAAELILVRMSRPAQP